jgi:hypothetical protein
MELIIVKLTIIKIQQIKISKKLAFLVKEIKKKFKLFFKIYHFSNNKQKIKKIMKLCKIKIYKLIAILII